ncbi:hypothetical protein [uncultured Parabacteroides sp.]|uniref:hypothetical protein n=1 Tax=uncultured Parabacteroides sp. TaxID=512312 RepID=UPI00351D741A
MKVKSLYSSLTFNFQLSTFNFSALQFLDFYFRNTGIAGGYYDADIAGGRAFEPVILQFVRSLYCSFIYGQELASATGELDFKFGIFAFFF